MWSPVTEIACFPLKSGISLEEPVREIISLGTKHEGYRCGFWGRVVESPDLLQFIVEWDSFEAHTKYTASGADFERAMEILGQITVGPPDVKHLQANCKVFNSPVVGMETFVVLSPSFKEDIENYLSALAEAQGYLGVTHGSTFEEELEVKGEKGKAYGVVTGWTSIEAHAEALKLHKVGNYWAKVKAAAKRIESHHVHLVAFDT